MFTLLLIAVVVTIALWVGLFAKINADISAPRPVKGYTYVTSWDGTELRTDPFTGKSVSREQDERSKYAVDPFVDGFKAASEASDW